MEQRRRYKAGVVMVEGDEFVYGEVSCSAGCVVITDSIEAGVPVVNIYATIDGINYKLIDTYTLVANTSYEIPHSGVFLAIKLAMVTGDGTISIASYWN